MQRVNFIPASRINDKRRRRHARLCAKWCGVYAAAALLIGGTFRLAWGDGKETAEAKLASADAIVEHTQLTLARSRSQLSAAKTALAVNRQLTAGPDWSRLFALLASLNGDSIVLKSCALNTRAEQPAGSLVAPVGQVLSTNGKSGKALSPPVPPRVVLLTISGDADSQLSVTQFVVRLEKTGVFKRVATLETHRELYLGMDATAFRLECILNEGEK